MILGDFQQCVGGAEDSAVERIVGWRATGLLIGRVSIRRVLMWRIPVELDNQVEAVR